MVTPPYMTMLQFIVVGSTVDVRGKKLNTNTGRRKQREAILMAIPQRPSVQRWGGKGSPRILFRRRQLIEIM